MAHTLLEQEWSVTSVSATRPGLFLRDVLGLTGTSDFYINDLSGVHFIARTDTNTYNGTELSLVSKASTGINTIVTTDKQGNIFYHISEGESVKYFKYVQSAESAENSYTYILAQDESGEWVVFNGEKMYSDYGITGIYNNPQIGRPDIVDSNNQFLISKACRFDTGVEFKELYFVLSAKSYSDTNCIVNYGGKLYRLVSVSNEKDETGRYPAFAFPVSD